MLYNDNQCYDCAFKHVSAAMVIWNEIQQGYNDILHLAKFVGNMSEASDHLVRGDPELANWLRDERVKFYDSDIHNYRPPFEDMLVKIIEAANKVEEISEV